MGKPLMVERAPLFFTLLTAAGLLMGAISAWIILASSTVLGGWEYWILVLGVICLLAGIWWMVSYLSRVSKFHHLMSEESKAAFIRKLDELEYLAWRLPGEYERRLDERKRELGIG